MALRACRVGDGIPKPAMRCIPFTAAMPGLDKWQAVQPEWQLAALHASRREVLKTAFRRRQNEICAPDDFGGRGPMWDLNGYAALATEAGERLVDLAVVMQCYGNPHMGSCEIILK
ncbi:hypothetical protein NEE01_14970 [Sphingomonas sp. MMSM24]|uniref:Uncharacterized protein n=1 Tax=Sphingomonas lycopersici TaxID=2951807 RepID=A0AA41ZG95_9SPHN|nr:hypothetical protein [Sphingomonas lycopersici]